VSRLLAGFPSIGARTTGLLAVSKPQKRWRPTLLRAQARNDLKRRAKRCHPMPPKKLCGWQGSGAG